MVSYKIIKSLQNAEETKQIKQLYLSNGWIDTTESDTEILIKKIIKSTFCFVIAVDEGRIIGMGRSISDGVSDAYIQDVTVLPEYRKKGIGGKIIELLIEYLHSKEIGWIGLISEPGYNSFYHKQGFSIMQGYTPFLYTKKK